MPSAPSQPGEVDYNPVRRIGFYALVGFLYFFNSRVADVSGIYILHLPLILGLLALLCALMSGSLLKALQTRAGICYLVLTVWIALGIPTAFWRGGSFYAFKGWLRTLFVWAFLVGLIATYRESKTLLNSIVWAAASAAVIGGAMSGGGGEERLSLDAGRFANPNYYALSMIIALPFVWRLYHNGGQRGLFRRLFAIAAGALIVVMSMRTGSRAALYAMALMVVMVLLRVSIVQKTAIVMAICILIAAFWVAAPRSLRERYLTLSSTGDAYQTTAEAVVAQSAAQSTLERQHLLKESIQISLQHPMFGLGMGNFAPFVFKLNQDEGRPKEPWLGTHNTYTQMSSETGLPSLLLFFYLLVLSWMSLGRVIRATRGDPRPEVRDIRGTALSAQVALAAFALSLVTIHIAYDIFTHMMIGIMLAVAFTSERELKLLGPFQPGERAAALANPTIVRSRIASTEAVPTA